MAKCSALSIVQRSIFISSSSTTGVLSSTSYVLSLIIKLVEFKSDKIEFSSLLTKELFSIATLELESKLTHQLVKLIWLLTEAIILLKIFHLIFIL
ncbi:MAG: hypothetical protein U9Q66_04080 [Patescibacteria group bacterium]|nr:hypothetical protein [Patescibacteria group bacterium]